MMKWLWLVSTGAIAAVTPVEEATLSFKQALTQIVDRSTTVAQQRTVLERTRARNLPSHLSMLPSLEGVVSETRRGGEPKAERGISATANLNIFKFGADAAAMRAANREEEEQELYVGNSILQAEAEGVSALVNYIQARFVKENLARNLEIRSESLRIARERFQRGLMPQQEVDKLSVELENTRANFRESEISFATTRALLTELLGTAQEVRPDWPWKDDVAKRGSPVEKLELMEAVQNRPDWQAAEMGVRAADERASQTFGKIFPSLDANFTYGLYQSDSYGVRGSGTGWNGGLALTIPLFDRLVNLGAYKAQVQEKAAAEVQREVVRRRARADWNGEKSAFRSALLSAQERDATLETSRKLYQNGVRRFQQGLNDADELGRDQERLYASELLAIQGWGSVHTHLTRLCHAAGRRVEQCLTQGGDS